MNNLYKWENALIDFFQPPQGKNVSLNISTLDGFERLCLDFHLIQTCIFNATVT